MTSKGTDRKTIRIETSLWDRLDGATKKLGTDRSTWLRDAARWCVGEPDAPAPKRPEAELEVHAVQPQAETAAQDVQDR